MNILSLFDGMSCGMIAMLNAGVKVDRYVAYEVDKYAIQTSLHNFPNIEQKGDVFKADFTEYEGFDFLIGGSPCTYWSIAQSPDKRETKASGLGWELFSQYVRALHEAKPKYFIYENNYSMSPEIRASITDTFGFDAELINSALVSAQNRQRLYWVGMRTDDGYKQIYVPQPEDKRILLKDILGRGVLNAEDKAPTITARYNKTSRIKDVVGDRHSPSIAKAERIPEYSVDKARCLNSHYANNSGTGEGSLEQRLFSDNKAKQQVDLIAENVGG